MTRMTSITRRKGSGGLNAGLLLVGILVGLVRPIAGAERRPLNRSIYVPVNFQLCPHLVNGKLYQEEQIVGVLPAERTFQFTYYPDLRRIEPGTVQMRVVGTYADGGEAFVGRVALTSGGLHTATEHIPFELTKEVEKLRYRIDLHLPRVALKIRCKSICSRDATAIAAHTDGQPEDEKRR